MLIKSIEKKFKDELTSDVYAVASLFDTNKLNMWSLRSFSSEYFKRWGRSIIDVALQYLPN